jgi:hypothetical protein
MRTLSRPMFNMGGPIKQGIMHGIREPYAGGGKAALVGNPVFPKDRTGRAHHAIQVPIGMGIMAGAKAIGPWAARMGSRYLPKIKRLFGTTSPGKTTQAYTGYSEYGPATYKTVTAPGKFNPNWLGRDPIVRTVGAAGKAIFNPTVGGWAGTAARFATSPSTVIGGVVWYLWPDGTQRKTPPPGNMIGAGPLHGVTDPTATVPEPTVKSQAEKDAFAKSQREKRVNKYLDMMGYDRSKKMAVADALIDASRIVSERGTLDPKNITQELINPVIQATSKRLDKPQQIREAVGLMATKAEIEKDLSAETDALAKTLKTEQIEGLRRQAKESTIAGDVRAYNTKHGKLPTGTNLAEIARLRGLEIEGVPNTTEVKKWMKSKNKDEIDYLTELTTTTEIDPGAYVVNNRILIVDENNTVKPYQY